MFNTCAVRENADNKLYGSLGHLLPTKKRHPGHADRGRRLPGPEGPRRRSSSGRPGSTWSSAPTTSARCRCCWSGPGSPSEAQVEIEEALETFPSTLPTRRDSAYAAWVSISVGCNNTCTFCIVPALRGKETDRRPGDILAEIEALVAEGVQEITLLGQNVNAYGVEFGDRHAFAKLLRACGEIDGLERVRFTSPHPKDFTDDVIAAMAETPNVMPQLHMPLQSGSDAVLRAMRRSYRSERYLGIIDSVRAAMPDAAITTDIIVGFPGETEADFQATLDVVGGLAVRRGVHLPVLDPPRHAGGHHAGPDARSRWSRNATSGWSSWSSEIAWQENLTQVGRRVEVMFADGEGRKDAATARMSGPGPGQPAGARRGARGSGAAAPAGRSRRGRDHLRRAAPPQRRRRAEQSAPDPGRRRLGGSAGRSGRPRRRQSGPALGGRARGSAGLGLRRQLKRVQAAFVSFAFFSAFLLRALLKIFFA